MAKTNTKNKITKIKRGSDGKFQKGSVSNGNKESKSGGRPTVMTGKTLERLIAAFKVGADDRTACDYAEIDPTTLYDYQKENPEFTQRKEGYKREPVLKARTTVVNNLGTNVSVAQWYLERKVRKEFGKDVSPEDSQKVNIGAPQNEKEAKLLELVLNKHNDYVRSKSNSRDTDTEGSSK